MKKSTKVDFFAVSEESPDLEILLRKLHTLPHDSPKRAIQPTDDWVRLSREELKGSDGMFGEMMRISMSPPGFRANLDGKITPILFDSDEGIGESAIFYYDFETRILALERNSKAVTAGQFAHFAKQVDNGDEDFDIFPILRPTDVGKVRTLHEIKKIHISANIIDVMPTIENIDAATKSVIQNSMIAESPAIEVVMKSGREKDSSLNHTVALETIQSWLKIHEDFGDDENQIVKKIEIIGKDDSGERLEFDMLKDRMHSRMDYDWEPDIDHLWDTRVKKIQQAWDLNHANLERNLKQMRTED